MNIIFFREEIKKDNIYNLLKNRVFFNKNNDVFSILPYQNKDVREAIKNLKFKNNKYNAIFFGELLFDTLPDYLMELEMKENFYNPILISTPMHFIKKIKRGYNQNDLIINEFLKLGGKEFIKWEKKNLVKIKHTQPQSLIKNKNERLDNKKGAYKIKKPDNIKNKNVILFDDIYTTGATINEIKKVLKKARAKNIKVVVLAH